MPTVYVDADAVPGPIREVLVRAAERRSVPVVFVANRWIQLPRCPELRLVQVPAGADEADDWIAEHAGEGDLVVTQDVPLAARVLPRGAAVIRTNGVELDARSITEALAMRDFAESLRGAGLQTGGPAPFHPRAKQQFSNALDRWITKRG